MPAPPPPSVHKAKRTLSCSVAREVTFPYRFLSFSCDHQLQKNLLILRSHFVSWKECGSCQWLVVGGGLVAFLSDGELDLLQKVRCFLFKEALLIRGRVLKKHIVLFEWRKNTSAIICPQFPASLVAFFLLKNKNRTLPCTFLYCNIKVREVTKSAGQASGRTRMLMHAGHKYVKGK